MLPVQTVFCRGSNRRRGDEFGYLSRSKQRFGNRTQRIIERRQRFCQTTQRICGSMQRFAKIRNVSTK